MTDSTISLWKTLKVLLTHFNHQLLMMMMMMITTANIQPYHAPSTVQCTLFSLHHTILTKSLWYFAEETPAKRGVTPECFSWLTNSYQSIKVYLKSHLLQETSFLFPLYLLHTPYTFSLIVLKPVFFLNRCIWRHSQTPVVLTALSLSAGGVSGYGSNTLKVRGVLSFPQM